MGFSFFQCDWECKQKSNKINCRKFAIDGPGGMQFLATHQF